jgi:hypothetical protein
MTDMTEAKTQEIIRDALKNCEAVSIYHNDETGEVQWSVTLCNDPEFWLTSFPTEEEARAYCKEHNLPISAVSSCEELQRGPGGECPHCGEIDCRCHKEEDGK